MTCSTCRNFRRGVAGRLGYCALDKRRAVLGGEEIRSCWQGQPAVEPAEGLFGSLNALLTPKFSASLATVGPAGPRAGPARSMPHEIKGRRRPAIEPATLSARHGRLVEAPVIQPSRRIESASDRAAARGVQAGTPPAAAGDSADDEVDGAPQDGPIA
jgi:hypothetical protein